MVVECGEEDGKHGEGRVRWMMTRWVVCRIGMGSVRLRHKDTIKYF